MNIVKERHFVTDSKGKRIGVVVDLSTYEQLVEAFEELEDIRSYDEAKNKVHAELRRGQTVPLWEYLRKKNRDK